MRIAFEADDSNGCTEAVLARITAAGHELVRPAKSQDWPEAGASVGRAVAAGEADLGVVMCHTGTGVSIAANKVAGVRAALAWEPWIAAGARRWNDANVLAMSLARLAPDVAVEVLDAFLGQTEVDPEQRRSIAALEA